MPTSRGQFKTRDGLYCYPLTVTDGYSRYLLSCQALSSTAVAEAKPVSARLFGEFGLPERIRTDNGVPFATTTLARLSSLSAFWVRLGNPNHERPHEALEMTTPASRYEPSLRPLPAKVPPLDYPGHFEVRYVSFNGGIRWKRDWANVSILCAGEYVGLEEIDNGIWNV